MNTNDLGLPFEYQIMPEFFDVLNISGDIESKNSIIEKLLRKHSINNANSKIEKG
jgi:hypothetical protein